MRASLIGIEKILFEVLHGCVFLVVRYGHRELAKQAQFICVRCVAFVIRSAPLCLVMMMQRHGSLALNAAFPVGLPVVPVEPSAPTDLIMGSV